tara:strand:- start:1776 stop:2081 length:306 start_codon:yes stop_codon:yes gene_type:complete
MGQNNFNKKDIYNYLSEQKGYSVSFSKKIINDLMHILISEIKSNSLNLKNIGAFKVINKKERLGRNPKTNEKFIIEARKSITFKLSKNLLKEINRYDEKVN